MPGGQRCWARRAICKRKHPVHAWEVCAVLASALAPPGGRVKFMRVPMNCADAEHSRVQQRAPHRARWLPEATRPVVAQALLAADWLGIIAAASYSCLTPCSPAEPGAASTGVCANDALGTGGSGGSH